MLKNEMESYVRIGGGVWKTLRTLTCEVKNSKYLTMLKNHDPFTGNKGEAIQKMDRKNCIKGVE